MITNINNSGLPDTGMLEQLANQLFSALPGDFSTHGISPQRFNTFDKDLLPNERLAFNVRDPQTSLPDPNFAGQGINPPSTSGIEFLPSKLPPFNNFKTDNFQEFAEKQGIPNLLHSQSSGSGHSASRSAIDQGNGVNVLNPQTSLPDPNRPKDSNFPGSLSGTGISPSVIQQGHPFLANERLPFSTEDRFATNLDTPLKSIISFKDSPQLPKTFSADPTFYFLSERDPQKFIEKATSFSGRPEPKSSSFGAVPKFPLDANLIKKDFPILQERVNGKQLIWLDNAATTQKPQQVIDRISYFYEHENSNIHRAAHELAARATDAYESARKKVQLFINAGSVNEIIFVRGSTEGINLVAKSWGEQNLQPGDEIIVSHLEHHANIVPWQQLAAKKGLKIRVIPVDDDGQVILDEYAKLLNPRTKLVSFTHVSNALGTITPAKTITAMAKSIGAKVLIDGAQSISHMRVDVQDLNCDWFVFSGHKVFGPTGIGVVYGKEELLNQTDPWQGGGNMIVDVTFEHTTYHKAPSRFEAGTGNIADAVGLGAAIDYVSRLGIDLITQYEHFLLVYATNLLKEIPGLKLIGTAKEKASVLSFIFDGFKTEEVGAVLNLQGIAVRSGHHCAQPILRRFGLEATVRPSLAFYNTCSDIDVLVDTLYKLRSGHK